jgi:hypothetical protein
MNELFQTGEKDKANEIFNEIKELQRIRKWYPGREGT